MLSRGCALYAQGLAARLFVTYEAMAWGFSFSSKTNPFLHFIRGLLSELQSGLKHCGTIEPREGKSTPAVTATLLGSYQL